MAWHKMFPKKKKLRKTFWGAPGWLSQKKMLLSISVGAVRSHTSHTLGVEGYFYLKNKWTKKKKNKKKILPNFSGTCFGICTNIL